MKRKQRSYVRIPTEKVEELKKEFELNQNCTAKFPELAKRLDLNVRQVRKWFENRPNSNVVSITDSITKDECMYNTLMSASWLYDFQPRLLV